MCMQNRHQTGPLDHVLMFFFGLLSECGALCILPWTYTCVTYWVLDLPVLSHFFPVLRVFAYEETFSSFNGC